MKKTIILSLLMTFGYLSNLYSQNPNLNSFSIPTEKWSLLIDLSGFKIEKEDISPDNSVLQVTAIDEKNNLNISIFIEKINSAGDKIACREFYWSKAEKSPLAKENLNKYETANSAVVEHDTKKYQGQVIDFHNLNAYLANNGYWIDVHISKIGYSKRDQKLFDKIVNSLSIKI